MNNAEKYKQTFGMDDLIRRSDAIRLAEQGQIQGFPWQFEQLVKLSSAQPERKKGEWIATYSDCGGAVWVSWKCSNCGYVRKKGWEHTSDGNKPDARFCEICNADMRGEENAD